VQPPPASRWIAIAAAALASTATLVLVADHLLAVTRATTEAARIGALEEQTGSDPEAAAALHVERERQTGASLARDARRHGLAWILLLSGGVLVAVGHSRIWQRPAPAPSLDLLVAERFGAAPAPRVPDRPMGPEPEAIDLGFVEELVARLGRSREAAIPMLQAVQIRYRYLPDEVLRRICEQTEITPAQIAGTSSFYAQFRRSPVGRHVVRICHGTACHVAGAERINEELRRHLGIPSDADTDPERRVTLDAVACVGCCSLAPVMMIEDDTAGRLTPASARRIVDALTGWT
jgi:NADH:ubiquinone oxidoreductase subunit E